MRYYNHENIAPHYKLYLLCFQKATAFYTITLLLTFQHVKFHEIQVCNPTVLRSFCKIKGKKG
jgi:hypothetical protein